ncbi:MAG: hypothetical protein QUS14_07130 [Pyrinomonadaceae bacterium]|nr:hypothetical protein [Pyrinomonadaceae bacterium]
MEQTFRLQAQQAAVLTERSSFAIDTTFVLFFLAVDFGHSVVFGGFEMALPLLTLLMFVFVPYFLPCDGERPEFGNWAVGRVILAVFGVGIGLALRQAIGTVFPEYFSHLPLTFLFVSAIFSCYIQFYGIIRVRLAR